MVSFRYVSDSESCRERLSSYINSNDPNDVVFVDNASHGINAVLRSLASNLLQDSNSKILYLQTAYQMVKNTLKFLNNVYDDQLLMLNVSFRMNLSQRKNWTTSL